MASRTRHPIHLKRAYEAPEAGDGQRLLVDGLWPRGLRKETLEAEAWLKALAPSTALRQWFGHEPSRWTEFQKRYRVELRQHEAELAQLRALAKKQVVTLIYGARDQAHNEAVVLQQVLLHGDAGAGNG